MLFILFIIFMYIFLFLVSCLPVLEGPMEIAWCCGMGVIPVIYMVSFMFLSWYSFLFFLVLLGGLLILFLYVSGLVPSVSYEFWFMLFISFQLSIMLMMMWMFFLVSIEMFDFVNYNLFNDFYFIFDNYFYLMSLFFMIYLLIGLLMVGILIDISEGPMRKISN